MQVYTTTPDYIGVVSGTSELVSIRDGKKVYLNSQETLVCPANQSDVTYTTIESTRNKYITNYTPLVTYDSGTFSSPNFSNINVPIKLQGDTRTLAGLTYIEGSTAVGVGNSGSTIWATNALGRIDFSTLVNGDRVYIVDNTGTGALYTVSSGGSEDITLTTTAPTIGDTGSGFTIVPNREFNTAMTVPDGANITLEGFYISNTCVIEGKLTIENSFNSGAVTVQKGGKLYTDDTTFKSVTVSFGSYGYFYTQTVILITGIIIDGGSVYARTVTATWCSTSGFSATIGGTGKFDTCYGFKCGKAYLAEYGGALDCYNSTAKYNTYGYYADSNGTIKALSTNARNTSNGTNYTENDGGVITYS